MIYGYARVSSNGQDLAQQLAQLDAAGCTKIYREKVSAATAERPQLKRAIGALDAGDVLMVTATDRLARDTRDLLNILHAVKKAGAGFRSIAEPMAIDANPIALQRGLATGIQCALNSLPALEAAIERAGALHAQPDIWRQPQINGMACDVSWRAPGATYARLFRGLVDRPAA